MGGSCNCLSFVFTGIKCQAGYYDFYLSDYKNGRPSYLGTIMSVEYKVFWDGTQWVLQQTDPSFPEIAFFSTVDTSNICELIGSDWQIGDITNFPVICLILSGLDVVLIDCPQLECDCYEFVAPCDSTVEYVDCDGNLQTDPISTGIKYNICSPFNPVFGCLSGNITNIGKCTNGQCPQPVTTTIPSIKPANECDVITIFPMEVSCFVVNPTNDKTFDGGAELIITGGTPPYIIYWEVGSYAPALSNLGVGEYSATVIDYYGDFTANTTCVLTAETLTISGMCFVVSGLVENEVVYISTESLGLKNGKPHYFLQYGIDQIGYVFWDQLNEQWTFCETLDCQITPYGVLVDSSFYPTGTTGSWVITTNTTLNITESYVGACVVPVPLTEEYDLCFSFVVSENIETTSVVNIDLSPAIVINGKPSWTSSTSSYLLYWNTGSTPSQWTITGYSPSVIFINNDTTYPPLSNWQVLGPPNITQPSVTTGTCLNNYVLNVSATDNDAICNNLGSITVFANGGLPPYLYSINGGQSYQTSPIFNGLLPGIYSATAKDSNNVVGTFGNVTITNNPPLNFQLSLVVDYVNNTFSITAPTLPGGITLNVDLVMVSIFTFYPLTLTPTPSYDNTTIIDGSYTMTFTNITTNIIPVSGPCSLAGSINAYQTQRTYTNTLTFTSNQTITGTTSNTIINPPTGLCKYANGYYFLNITNPKANNCKCCKVTLLNPTPPTPPIF
jgi:hypothetical protein